MTLPAVQPNVWMVTPFVALLAAMALAPLFCAHWWRRHYMKVSFALGAITLVYYLGALHANERLLHTGMDFLSFVSLIGSFFVVAVGIHIGVKGEPTPKPSLVL